MKHPFKNLFTIHFHLFLALALAAPSPAAVPLEWTARPGEIAPAQFTRHHGETLELRCRFAGFGELPFSQGADIRLWYQTNGMPSSAWWSVPAQASSNTLSAVFAPECDPGADQVKLFFGAPSNAYASAVLRLRPSPGAEPNALPPPEGFAESDPVFAAWLATDPFSGLAPADYETVSNRAMSAVQPGEMAAAIAAATNALPAAATDLTPATNYTDAVAATLRAKSDLAYRNAAHNGIEKWVVTIQGETATLTAEWNDEFQKWLSMEEPVNGLGIRIAGSGYTLETTGGEFPFTLSGGSATVSDGWFTYTLAPVDFPVDRLALVSETATIAGQIGTATNALAGNLAVATNALAREIEGLKQMIAADGEWNRPGEWTLGFSAIPTTPTILAYTIETNQATGVIVSNATVTEAQSLAAHVFSFSLDEFAHTPAPAVALTCDDPSATIEGDVLTATANGVYTVLGTSTNGDTRAVDVPIYQAGVKERRKTTYIADDAGTGRKSVNDKMSMDLTMMSGGEVLPYFAKGTEQTGFFRAWRTVTPWWAWPGRGCYSPWAVAPKVMVSAAHYGAGWREGDWTIFDNAGQTNFTVRIGSWVTLVSWARTHGFTSAETSVADMGDIKVAPIVQGQIPDACLPYLMDADELAEMFGGDMDGVMAWHYPQGDAETDEGNHYFWCIPVMLRQIGVVTADTPKLPYSTIYWNAASFFGDASAASVREDILSGIGLYDARQWFRIRSGDSGRPCFIRLAYAGGAPVDVPIAQTHWISGGSSIPAAAKVIRAYSLQVTGLLPKTLLRQ